KAAWIEEVIEGFETGPWRVDGRPIEVELEKMGSRQMYLAVLDEERQPDIISPASSLQISILHDLSQKKNSLPIVGLVDPSDERCKPVLNTPLVLVAWRERAEVLFGSHPGAGLWNQLYAALVNPEGWGAFGYPEWSYIKFGHTDPTKSNSGFMSILLLTYNYLNKDSNLEAVDILSNQEYQDWLINFESGVSEFGDSTGTYMNEIIAYGPSKYDIVAVYEATAIEHIENASGRYGELLIYYPPATVMSDHPFCVLDAEWVTEEKQEAAILFIEYLTSQAVQEKALMSYGFRPVHKDIPLDQKESPFLIYNQNGIRIELPPSVEIPPGDVLDTLLTYWIRNIQR
ncbi:MAG: extracellular solute-binding protein, partial [Anaerolineales bacterium]